MASLINLDYKSLYFFNDKILINKDSNNAFLDLDNKHILSFIKIINKYKIDNIEILNCKIELANNSEYALVPVKNFLIHNDQNNQYKILKAYQLLNWHNRSKFCGSCGNKLVAVNNTTEKSCHICKISFFPRFSPAIMVLIKKNKQILLARSPHFTKGMYSALAGFIDLGESAEDAVYREVKEEVGISIENIKYFGTQAWPFPDSFMIAFIADYHKGEIKIDQNEIEDAKWFDIDNLPALPSHISISRQLIDNCIITLNRTTSR